MPSRHQRGAVMVVSLLLLLVMTMLVVSSVNTGTVNLRIVDNMRARQDAEAVTQVASNEFMSDGGNFVAPTSGDTLTVDGHEVTVTAPECVDARPATGYTATWDLTPDDTVWEFDAEITDGDNGARASVRQGVHIRMPAGSCP